METNPNVAPPPVPQMPHSPKKKKGKGCLIALAIFFGLGIIGAIFSDGDKNLHSKGEKTDSAEVVDGKGALTDNTPQVDSVKIKELKPLFNEKKDEFKGVTWIEPKSAPKYRDVNGYYTYFDVDKNGKPENLRLVIQYYAKNWLFIQNYTFLIDGETYNFTPPSVEHDNNSMIWEWSDTSTENGEVAQILNAIKNAKEVKIRFNGRQYQEDKTLTPNQLQSIKQPIEYFEALGGRF